MTDSPSWGCPESINVQSSLEEGLSLPARASSALGFVLIVIHSFIHCIFIKHLLCSRYMLGGRDIRGKPTSLFLDGLTVWGSRQTTGDKTI
jgi:hypothetical protein